jgi:hypothetical protein
VARASACSSAIAAPASGAAACAASDASRRALSSRRPAAAAGMSRRPAGPRPRRDSQRCSLLGVRERQARRGAQFEGRRAGRLANVVRREAAAGIPQVMAGRFGAHLLCMHSQPDGREC